MMQLKFQKLMKFHWIMIELWEFLLLFFENLIPINLKSYEQQKVNENDFQIEYEIQIVEYLSLLFIEKEYIKDYLSVVKNNL